MPDILGKSHGSISSAVEDFHSARRKAALENLMSSITGKSSDLLAYDEIRAKLHGYESSNQKLEDIPIDAIVGSVGRYADFSRSFLPRRETDRGRWSRVRVLWDSQEGLPPIEAYKIGDAYFVLDGHHRVSVAKEVGAPSIQGYVTEVRSRVPLSPNDQPDDIILKAEYVDFLAKTKIDELRPGSDLLVTAPGQYPKLLEHISVHRYLMGLNQNREVPYFEAVAHWYDTVYIPLAQLILDHNLLRDFPGRTVTDLYLWIMDHRLQLGGGDLGWEVSSDVAAKDFSARYSPIPRRRLPRLLNRLQKTLLPKLLEPGPPAGQWRREHQDPHRGNRLFDDLLVAVTGDKHGWHAVDMAIEVARREEARLRGMHFVSSLVEKESEAVQQVREEFARRCAAAGVAGRMLVEVGNASNHLLARSNLVDLIVFRSAYPPPSKPLSRLRSGTRTLIRQSNAPLLAVPGLTTQLSCALLAFGEGRKAEEALYLAAYLAEHWHISLVVVSVQSDGENSASPIERARKYLDEHGIEATYVQETGDPARLVLLNSEKHCSDLIIMGGYESGLFRESLLGSTVDRVLRSASRPVLICN